MGASTSTVFNVYLSIDTNNDILYNIQNISTYDCYACSYGNPLESPKNSQLNIVDSNGTTLQYRGIQCERNPPELYKSAWILIPKGQTVSKKIDLSVYQLVKGSIYNIELDSNEILYSYINNTPVSYYKQSFISNKIAWTC